MFKLSTNKCYNEWFKSIEHILNVLLKYKPKRNVGLYGHFQSDILSFGVPKNQIVSYFLQPHFLYFFSNLVVFFKPWIWLHD
jgi:hypothetical protein